MHSLEQLTERIIASPDDKALRLQFSEILSAAGDPKGEIICLQCELDGLTEQDSEWYWRRFRLANLLRGANPFQMAFGGESLESRWTSELDAVKVDGKSVGKGMIERGFVEAFTVFDVNRMKSQERDILSISPLIRSFEFSELSTNEQFSVLASLACLDNAKHLKFSKCRFPSGQLEFIFELPQLKRLNRLMFSECSFEGGIEALGRTQVAENLEELSISLHREQADEFRENDCYLGSLLSGNSFPHLNKLEFDQCCFANDLARLTQWSGIKHLTDLEIGAHHWPIGVLDDFLQNDFQSLECLRLSRLSGQIDRLALSAEHLRILSLKGVTLNANALQSLSANVADSLQHLTLSSCGLETPSLQRFLRGKALANLRYLNLQLNQLDATAVKQIVETEWLDNLVTLKLSFNPLGFAAGEYLSSSRLIKNLAFLDLCETQLEDVGLQRLAEAPASKLQWLNLESNEISSDSLDVLLEMSQMTHLVALRINGNEVFDQHKLELVERYGKEAVDSYWLGYLV